MPDARVPAALRGLPHGRAVVRERAIRANGPQMRGVGDTQRCPLRAAT
jgi:hypothetical protein